MNIELSKNNHMVWGYNDIPWSFRKSTYDKFFIKYGKIKQELSFRDSCILTATEISQRAEKLNKKPLIFFSGGIDSEAMIYSFLLSKKDFSIVHIQYLPDLNNHEYEYVKKVSKKNNLDVKLFKVDLIEFLSREETFIKAIRDNSRMIELHALTSITDQIKDHFLPVLDHLGYSLFRSQSDMSKPGEWIFKDYELLMFYCNYCLNESLDACPSFYHWSPEILYSFLTDPLIQDLVNGRISGKISNRTSTMKLYQNTFPEFIFESREKYTGYEFLSKTFLNDLNFRLYEETKYDRSSGQTYRYLEILNMLK